MLGANWKTGLFGILSAVPYILHGIGIAGIGHLGTGSFDQLIGAIGALGLGYYAKDKNVTGGNTLNTVSNTTSSNNLK